MCAKNKTAVCARQTLHATYCNAYGSVNSSAMAAIKSDLWKTLSPCRSPYGFHHKRFHLDPRVPEIPERRRLSNRWPRAPPRPVVRADGVFLFGPWPSRAHRLISIAFRPNRSLRRRRSGRWWRARVGLAREPQQIDRWHFGEWRSTIGVSSAGGMVKIYGGKNRSNEIN